MKFLAVTLALVAAASADIVTRDLPFLKTLASAKNYVDYQKPYVYNGYSRCEFTNSTRTNIKDFQKIAGSRWACTVGPSPRNNFCTVKPQIRDLTSVEFVRVTAALCAKHNGFLMIDQGPDDSN
ncbi:hypothetical protein EMPS_04778 [Entomortierella parvispora]|uniref:Uncharacterized protein n=1 Tax=Entomortierella parvispora TaxID=205924 RepID=A0A9P3H990_9FUNG|nr:hypothetical protein EMPS_04778 [Entomortierella parvispora]